uniref:Uncharacterized protein n=1 Tax=Chrysotila carterae TaxID=13221 RepID=A0A7S4C0H3_CHRCT|mmetsp:Transcript_11470/g.24772  ORF Transcript_11470/g.24772 Transcript_11470/m.24772 type:complete len:174 (-) Transcript_11470:696-1217(-)
MTVAHSDEDVRDCIRMLVAVIRSAHSGNSPVHEEQLAQMRKVVRLLSLSREQIDAMPVAERESVLHIRHSAIQKMIMARAVQKAPAAPYGNGHCIKLVETSSPLSIPNSHGSAPGPAPQAACIGGLPHSAPSTYGFDFNERRQSLPQASFDRRQMPPPAFYVRKMHSPASSVN